MDDHIKTAKYNPHAWNDAKTVEPPKNVWMRTELIFPRLNHTARNVAQYTTFRGKTGWFSQEGRVVHVDRFRPWDD